jgi:hypothetical protein
MSKRRRANNIDGAQGERYLASPQRLEFMLRLAARQNAEAVRANTPTDHRGNVTNETYSLTEQQSRYVFRGLA